MSKPGTQVPSITSRAPRSDMIARSRAYDCGSADRAAERLAWAVAFAGSSLARVRLISATIFFTDTLFVRACEAGVFEGDFFFAMRSLSGSPGPTIGAAGSALEVHPVEQTDEAGVRPQRVEPRVVAQEQRARRP